MSMIFQFRALSDENDGFLREYRLLHDSTLLDFHNLICEDLKYDTQAMASFFLSDKHWDKQREFTAVDMDEPGEDAPRPMGAVTVRELISDNGDRLIYTFDPFGNRSLFLEMTGVYKAEAGVQYPQTTLSQGDAPAQFEPSAILDSDSAFDEAMAEFGGFEGDDNYQDDF